jgi:hypothetical protein
MPSTGEYYDSFPTFQFVPMPPKRSAAAAAAAVVDVDVRLQQNETRLAELSETVQTRTSDSVVHSKMSLTNLWKDWKRWKRPGCHVT